MRKLFLSLAALSLAALVCPARAASPQDQRLEGTWQGTLKEGTRELRLVFKISLENGKLTAVNYNLDEGAVPVKVSAITRSGSTVKMSLATVAGRFEGKLSSDGNTISGTFSRLTKSPLTLQRATAETAWTIPDAPEALQMLAADAKPEFEVVTIKPSKLDERFAIRLYPGGTLEAVYATLSDLIRFAYEVHPSQISGGPGWIDSERFDLTGKSNGGATPSLQQSRGMVRQVLSERFALEFHREKREMSVYSITIVNGGTKLTASPPGPTVLPSFRTTANGIVAQNASMADFAQILQANFLDQPVIDRTELGNSRFAFTLKWTPDAALAVAGRPAAPQNDDSDAPDLFTAFQQQLGLKLQSTRSAADVLVIDRAEKPSAN